MSWTCGKAAHETGILVKPAAGDRWTKGTVLLASGVTVPVKRVESNWDSSPGQTLIELESAHGVPMANEVWFMYVEVDGDTCAGQSPHSDKAMSSVSPAGLPPPPPQYPPIPSRDWEPTGVPNFARYAIPAATTAPAADTMKCPQYPQMPSGFRAPAEEVWERLQHQRQFDEVAGYYGDDVDQLVDGKRSVKWRFVPGCCTCFGRSDASGLRVGGYDDGSGRVAALKLAATIVIVNLGFVLTGVEIAVFVGRIASIWLLVLLWTLLGVGLLFLAQGLFYMFAARRVLEIDKGSTGEFLLRVVALVSAVTTVLFSNAFGVSGAWCQAQIVAADELLKPEYTKVVGCWRNPNETITQSNTRFLFVDEPQWMLDYSTRLEQKVWTLRGSDDSGTDNGERFNYCVAPIRYYGNVPCSPNLWAVCYRRTENYAMGSCDEDDAAYCGWNYLAGEVTLRVLSTREQFWSIHQEDMDGWMKALLKVPKNPDATQEAVLIGWGFEGPDDISSYRTNAISLLWKLRLGAAAAALVVALLLDLLVLKYVREDPTGWMF